MNGHQLSFARRLRTSPFERRSLPGARGVSVYNHVVLPTVYESLEEDYWHLREHVQIWDVACQVQVEVRGPDALRLVEWMTPRDVSACVPGQCIYAPLADENGGMVNDPIVLCLAPDRYWLSLADSDVLLWAKGLVQAQGWQVEVFDPDVFPLSVQGPKAEEMMSCVLGAGIRDLGFFRFIHTEVNGIEVFVARTGWSGQGGFEIYLGESARGVELWDSLADAGKELCVRPGAPNLIDRIEAGLLSYGNDMTLDNNPFEIGLDRFFRLGKRADYLARSALEKIAQSGPARKLVRLVVDGAPIDPPRGAVPVLDEADRELGFVTSMVFSPRLELNIGFALVPSRLATVGTSHRVATCGGLRAANVVDGDWSIR